VAYSSTNTFYRIFCIVIAIILILSSTSIVVGFLLLSHSPSGQITSFSWYSLRKLEDKLVFINSQGRRDTLTIYEAVYIPDQGKNQNIYLSRRPNSPCEGFKPVRNSPLEIQEFCETKATPQLICLVTLDYQNSHPYEIPCDQWEKLNLGDNITILTLRGDTKIITNP
jgi:hypothetical protein